MRDRSRNDVDQALLPAFTAVPRQRNRHDGWTADRQRRFIEALADTGSVRTAVLAVNMSSDSAYQLRRSAGAESFREAWEAALQLGVQRLEDIAYDRAINGVETPVYSYGKLIGTRMVHNDRLLMFILRNRAGERYAAGLTNEAGMRKRWRQAWDREQYEKDRKSDEDIRAIIDARFETVRERLKIAREQQYQEMVTAAKAEALAQIAAEAAEKAAGKADSRDDAGDDSGHDAGHDAGDDAGGDAQNTIDDSNEDAATSTGPCWL